MPQSPPVGHAVPSESPAPSATSTVAESDDTERTLAATPRCSCGMPGCCLQALE
ncbi:hypothetical protein FRC02_005546, partial [Tulasnella sp. 418]